MEYRRSSGRRMEASRARSGNMHLGILETGKTTRKTGLAFSSTKMETSMRVCGSTINATGRVLTGAMKVESSEENTLAIGTKIKNMAEAHSSIRMETVTTATGFQACLRVKVA